MKIRVTPNRPLPLLRAWSWVQDSRWALYSIGHGIFRPQLPAAYTTGRREPVLIIPGVFENWTMMRRLCDRINAAGHPVHVLLGLSRNTMPVAQAAAVTAAYLRENSLDQVIVLAHSKGGLIGKYLLVKDPSVSIKHLVAIATPFAGSPYARLVRHPVISGFREDDPLLLELGAQVTSNARITTITPAFDPYIPAGSALEGAQNHRVASSGHFRVLGDPAVSDLVLRTIAQASSPKM
ncbi:esterase/lipase family protein [Glutamicibacter sp.]|uniref:esterase/lipase family protein n=1 Tax=Glutamicibacter sp. TaxID=1931995 RepID=UPI002FE21E4C